MIKQRILHGLKIIIIVLLVMVISMLVILRWKSDIIIEKVLSSVQHELVDSLQYTTADMNWFSHFPLISIQIYDLTVGSETSPFIEHCDVNIIIGLLPLLKNEITINQLAIKEGSIYIQQKQGRWSYDVFKKKDADASGDYSTRIRQLIVERLAIVYEDKPSTSFSLAIDKGILKGSMVDGVLEADINIGSTINLFTTSEYSLPTLFKSNLTGHYVVDLETGEQRFEDFEIDCEAVQLNVSGTMLKDTIDMDLVWKKANPELVRNWLPKRLFAQTKAYKIIGEFSGQSKIEGVLSKNTSLNIHADVKLKNGTILFLDSNEEIKGIALDLTYLSSIKGKKPGVNVQFEKSGIFGPSFKGEVHIENLQSPVFDLSFEGSLPASLLNLLQLPGLHFEKGTFKISQLTINKIQPSKFSINTLFQQGFESIETHEVQFKYHENEIEIVKGSIGLANQKINIELDKLVWNKAIISNLKSTATLKDHQIDYKVSGKLCEGAFSSTGIVVGFNQRPVANGRWTVTDIQIDQLLESFSNFDQEFITSKNLSGKTNLWVDTKLPFDEQWNLLSKQVVVKSAIDIREGRLRDMHAFEEFSKFVHLDDLRDIRFNQIRNYMLIEKGKVYLPVMFIQSSALNLSISGEHGFDEEIIYYLKLNVGQVASAKLKKNKSNSDFVKASKSGWINMYFALGGTTQDVTYQQYKKAVIAGFEKSTQVKEKLRDELVAQFGYDVYWLEPNEWEDIPEYQ